MTNTPLPPFSFYRTPRLAFGPGRLAEIAAILGRFGRHVLLVTGGRSLARTGRLDHLVSIFKENAIGFDRITVTGEPSPELIDDATAHYRPRQIDAVLAVGGGSVLDAGKAISAMLTQQASVCDFLEGIGKKVHSGRKIPFIAVPTTAGTGSEATKNAVLSRIGAAGYKKSLRHDNFVPDVTLIDPQLMVTCPSDTTAACGMDALTQLIEAYVSTAASPMTDALSLDAIGRVHQNLAAAGSHGSNDIAVRSQMAYAAFISGVVLANAGLGIVHGLASPAGGFFDIPHGVVCGTLLAAATRTNIAVLRASGDPLAALTKYGRIGALLSNRDFTVQRTRTFCDLLVEKLEEWTDRLHMPRLGRYGIKTDDIDKLAAGAGLKNNPARLDAGHIRDIVAARL